MSTERVHGPYRDGPSKWRVVVVRPDGRRSAKCLASQAEALALIASLERAKATRTTAQAIDDCVDYLARKGNKQRSISTTQHRLTALVSTLYDSPLTALTSHRCQQLYAELANKVSVDTHRNTLGQARTWGRWMTKQGWLKSDPWTAVEAVGRRRRGKPQLRVDEAKQLWAYLKPRLHNPGSLAVGCVLLLGLRCSEVVGLERSDLDCDGTVLWVEDAKTRAGDRRLNVLPVLVEPLRRLAQERARLFPHRREWVLDLAQRRARQAGIARPVTAHGLRGLHATLRVEYAQLIHDMGHSGVGTVTRDHYIAPGALERVTAQRVWEVLDG